VAAVQSSCARQGRHGHCFCKHRTWRGEGQGGLGALQGLGAARVGRRQVLGASARRRVVAENRLLHGACVLGRGGIQVGEGDRTIMARGWRAAVVAGWPDSKLADWLV
jgi:hypothetical protein